MSPGLQGGGRRPASVRPWLGGTTPGAVLRRRSIAAPGRASRLAFASTSALLWRPVGQWSASPSGADVRRPRTGLLRGGDAVNLDSQDMWDGRRLVRWAIAMRGVCVGSRSLASLEQRA